MFLSAKDFLNLAFCVASSGLIAYGPMAHKQGGPGAAFSYHPFLMGIGFAMFLTMGFWMFNYEDLPGDWINTRAARRKAHAIVQASGAFCVFAGYAAVLGAHLTSGNALFQVSEPPMGFPSGPSWLRLVHVLLGYFALALLALQVYLGLRKYRMLTDADELHDDGVSIHEKIGYFLYFCGVSNVMIGVWLWQAWSLPLRVVITLTMLTSLAFGPRWDGSQGFLSTAEEHPAPQLRSQNERGPGGSGSGSGNGTGGRSGRDNGQRKTRRSEAATM